MKRKPLSLALLSLQCSDLFNVSKFDSMRNGITTMFLEKHYGCRNGAKFTKFIFIHIQCCYCCSRIYLFTFNNQVSLQEIYLFTVNGVFLIHDYIYSHLRDVFIHIPRVIFVHIHDRNIHSTFSALLLCASLGPSSRSIICERSLADEG